MIIVDSYNKRVRKALHRRSDHYRRGVRPDNGSREMAGWPRAQAQRVLWGGTRRRRRTLHRRLLQHPHSGDLGRWDYQYGGRHERVLLPGITDPPRTHNTRRPGVAVDGAGNFYIADNSRLRKVSAERDRHHVRGYGRLLRARRQRRCRHQRANQPPKGAVDASGNLFFVDFFNVVSRVSTNGTITTVAGNGTAGYSGDGGQAISAQLAKPPGGLAVDAAGNFYIADSNNNRIRKVSMTGIIATVAGNGTAGFAGDGGQATVAQLNPAHGRGR